MIPFLSFEEINKQTKAEMLQAFEKFFDGGSYVLGEAVKQFEDEYAAFNDVKFCKGISNGLDALHIALRAVGVGEGDEVIVPANTYIATLLAVSYTGAKPVLAEPDRRTYNIDPKNILEVLTPKTKAIIPVHLYGQAADMDSVMTIAREHKLAVVEDNAQSQGAAWNGKLTGSFGHINATSFYPGKNLGALGDAGAVTTNISDLDISAASLRNYGSSKKYYNDRIGYNMRLDECQATFLSVKLKYLRGWTNQRQRIASLYDKHLATHPDLIKPFTAPGATHVYHLYVVRSSQRAALAEYLNSHGAGTLIHYPVPPHLQEAYAFAGWKKGDFPIAEDIAETCLSLPLWPGMPDEQVMKVCELIDNFFK